MSKMLTVLAAVLAVVLMSGCTSMQVANRFNGLPVSETEKMPPKAHVNVTMTGFYLFHCLPIATGSVGSVDKWAIFKDTVSVENAVSVKMAITGCVSLTTFWASSPKTTVVWLNM